MKETIERQRKGLRTAAIYAAFSLLAAVFGMIYTHYGHGVKSPYMSFAFLFLLGGAFLYVIFGYVGKLPYPTLTASRYIAYSLTAFTLDSILQGVLDIAGAFSNAKIVMTVVAVGFAFAAAAVYFDRWQTQ